MHITDEKSCTPLECACRYGHMDITRILLSHGADLNAPHHSFAYFILACMHGHTKLAEMLIEERGAEINCRYEGTGSAIQAASVGGHINTVRMLIDHGADVNLQGGHWGNALQAALANGHERTAEVLLTRGAYLDTQRGGYARSFESILSLSPDIRSSIEARLQGTLIPPPVLGGPGQFFDRSIYAVNSRNALKNSMVRNPF